MRKQTIIIRAEGSQHSLASIFISDNMASLLNILMLAIVGPLAILKVYAKSLIRQAYKNRILLKLLASIISLMVGSQIAYHYRYQYTCICLVCGLLGTLVNYWYIIPIVLIYIFPIIDKLVKSWFSFINLVSNNILRPHTKCICKILPSICLFESNQTLWPIESIHFILKYGVIGPAIYCAYPFLLIIIEIMNTANFKLKNLFQRL